MAMDEQHPEKKSSEWRSSLQPFFASTERGEIATVEQIQQAFEAQVQHEVYSNSIYRLLHRHGWLFRSASSDQIAQALDWIYTGPNRPYAEACVYAQA